MNTQIIPVSPTDNSLLIPEGATGHTKSRLGFFVKWLDETGQHWLTPDLEAYRDYLRSYDRMVPGKAGQMKSSRLSPESTLAHLATIRGRYRALLRNNDAMNWLKKAAAAKLAQDGHDVNPANIAALVNDFTTQLKNAIDPHNVRVKKIVKKQDQIDAAQLRLTKAQADALVAAPARSAKNATLQSLRDTAIIALMLCTGVREMELCGLDVADLRQTADGELALHVREGKGGKERIVPYGPLDWALALVERWLAAAGITDEKGRLVEGAYVIEPKPDIDKPDKNNPDHWEKRYPVFRGFYKGGKRVRPGRLTLRAINQIMDRYPISINGERRVVKPHDCRRTYARRVWEAGIDPVIIQQNLGHADIKTTMLYIGQLNIKQRIPPAIYSEPDLSFFDRLV